MWLFLVGCAPGALSEEEAAAVFEAVTAVNEDVYARVWARTKPTGAGLDEGDTEEGDTLESPPEETAAAKGMQWHTAADGGTFDGTIDGPGSWTGSVALDGAYGVGLTDGDDWAYTWGMDAGYVDVGYGSLTLDGELRWDIEATYGVSTFTHTSTLVGELTARGGATGAGEISTVTRVTLTGGRYVVGVSGTVGGYDMSRQYDASGFGL